MKTFLASLLSAAAALVFFSQCNRQDNTVFRVHFYTPQQSHPLRLYVGGTDWGMLPYAAQEPTCADTASDRPSLYREMPSGSYHVECKDSTGQVRNISEIRFSKNTMGCSGGMGGTRVSNKGTCIMVGLEL